MPSFKTTIDDVMSSVERPIIFSVIRQLMELTGISHETQIRYYGDEAKAAQWGSFSVGQQDAYSNLWPHRQNITIEVEEDADPGHILNTAAETVDVPLLFSDQSLGISIKPIYSTTNVVIRVVYRCADKNEALKWRSDIMIRYPKGREIMLHRLQYSYALPQPFQLLVEHLHSLRSDDISLSDWWYACASPRFTVALTQAGTSPTVVVAETQGDVQGYFDFEGIPQKPAKADETSMWELSFSYQFKYEKPIAMHARFPLVVHQKLVAPIFRGSPISQKFQAQLPQLNASSLSFRRFNDSQRQILRMGNAGLVLPAEDDWSAIESTIPSNTFRVLTGLTTISDQDKRTLLDLKDLGDYNFTQDVLQFMMQSEYPHMCLPGSSIFHVTAYENHRVLDFTQLEVTGDLIVRSTVDLDMTKSYHVRVGMYGNLHALASQARQRMMQDRQLLQRLVAAINAVLGPYGQLTDMKKNSLTQLELASVGLSEKPELHYGWALVQILFVQPSLKQTTQSQT